MKSLKNYIDTYRSIAKNLNISGDSAELLIQLLANASYISEVENIVYSQESSLERATLLNSKIQQCVDLMYSVYRGQCPRIILNIKSMKPLKFNTYDNIITLNNLKVYYLGYYDEDNSADSNEIKNYGSNVKYENLSIEEIGEEKKILCLLAKDKIEREETLKSSYYVDFIDEDISNDIKSFLYSGTEGYKERRITRHFSDHVLNKDVFDLTIPGFGSRLYIMDEDENKNISKIKAQYFKLTKLSSYNNSELKKLNLKGAELLPFEEAWKKERGLNINNDINTGIIAIPEVEPDSYLNIHYKANQNRYLNTIFRSNEDLGYLLKEMYPDIIEDTKIMYDDFSEGGSIIIYYIPKDSSTLLSSDEISDFLGNRKSYFVTEDNIKVVPGNKYNAIFDITVRLFENETDSEVVNGIGDIIDDYKNKFDINFLNNSDNYNLLEKSVTELIKSLISKIPKVKNIEFFKIKYSDLDGNMFEEDYTDDFFLSMYNNLYLGKSYYTISCNISTVI